MPVTPTRQDDLRVLAWLSLRQRRGTPEIARIYHTTPPAIRVATNRVIEADIAESGEDPAMVRAAYRLLPQSDAIRRGKRP